jgi:hypothetical protein
MTEEFNIQKIKEKMRDWVELDIELKNYKKIIKDLNKQKKDLSIDLVNFMKHKKIDMIDINNGNDTVIYQKKTVKSGISKKYLEESLMNYFSNDKTANEIVNFILNNRKQNIKETIIRK